MKALVTAIMFAFATFAVQAAEPAKKDAKPAAVQNENCVKKDKNGKCPPLPDSPKPTPKKKAEEKK
jgi:hypothetical protein